MRKRLLIVICVVALTAVLSVGGILFHHFQEDEPQLPMTITKQVSFVIYVPSEDWIIPASNVSYTNGVLTYTATKAMQNLTFTEQATPEVFSDVPQYFSTLTTRLNEYATVGSANGQAHLTKPKELNGDQQAVLNSDGTLLFVHPDKQLSTDDWRRLFNNLQVIKP